MPTLPVETLRCNIDLIFIYFRGGNMGGAEWLGYGSDVV